MHTIFGEGTNAVAGEYLGSIRSCQRLETFSCKQSRGYIQQELQDIGGYGKDIQRENNLTKIQNRD